MFGRYLPLGWAGVVRAGWCLGGTYLRAGRDGVWAVLTSGLGGRCKGGMVFGRYLPPGWTGWCVGGTYLWAGRAL